MKWFYWVITEYIYIWEKNIYMPRVNALIIICLESGFMSLVLLVVAVSIATKSCTWCSDSWLVWTFWFYTQHICVLSFSALEEKKKRSDLKLSWQFVVDASGRQGEQTVMQYRDEWSRSVFAFVLHSISRLHLIPSALRPSLPLWFNQISFRNLCRTSYRTCRTHIPSNFWCVINHVEIKVKGEGLTLSSES